MSTPSRRHKTWSTLTPHALPDSRHNLDFSLFTPDFRSSDAALDHLCALPCYTNASTLYIGPDNSLTALRVRALRDGKKVLVASYGLRRGLWMLDPRRICEGGREKDGRFEVAGLLDGMERTGFGRRVGVAGLREEGVKVELCVTGSVVVGEETGERLGEGRGWFDLVWGVLGDVGVVGREGGVVVVTMVHDCQVVGGNEEIGQEVWDVGVDFIVTPTRVVEVQGVKKPGCGVVWESLKGDMMGMMPPLQELKGIQIMEDIMRRAAEVVTLTEEKSKTEAESGTSMPKEDELVGIGIVERLMKGYKS